MNEEEVNEKGTSRLGVWLLNEKKKKERSRMGCVKGTRKQTQGMDFEEGLVLVVCSLWEKIFRATRLISSDSQSSSYSYSSSSSSSSSLLPHNYFLCILIDYCRETMPG